MGHNPFSREKGYVPNFPVIFRNSVLLSFGNFGVRGAVKSVPSLNCGLCGAPTCKNHADDAAAAEADLSDCVFLSRDRINFLREIYKK